MCWCTPSIRTPCCGRPGCQRPPQTEPSQSGSDWPEGWPRIEWDDGDAGYSEGTVAGILVVYVYLHPLSRMYRWWLVLGESDVDEPQDLGSPTPEAARAEAERAYVARLRLLTGQQGGGE